jgi:transaldolase
MSSLCEQLKVKIFADCADFESIKKALNMPLVRGFTTNPSLVSKAGVASYTEYAQAVLKLAPDMPVSFEVLADAPEKMGEEARIISSWGRNVYVKIPVVNTRGESQAPLIRELSSAGIALNVTVVFTAAQCAEVARHLNPDVPALVSVFAGRIADAGWDPLPIIEQCRRHLAALPKAELLWASVREVYNIFQADASGCRVVTAPLGMIEKLGKAGRDLTQCSIDGVKAFMDDIKKAGIRFR